MDVMYADTDANGLPLGLLTAINTGDAGSGNLVINLQKDLNKLAAGVSEGQIDNAGGKTDIQATFPVIIE